MKIKCQTNALPKVPSPAFKMNNIINKNVYIKFNNIFLHHIIVAPLL